MYDVNVNPHGITNFTFPFSLAIDSNNSTQKNVLTDFVNKCGSNTSANQNIEFDYYIHPTIRIFNVPISPNVTKTISIPCPLQVRDINYQDIPFIYVYIRVII